MTGEPLTREEVEALPHGALVEIIWSLGNGPHRYRIHRSHWGIVALTEREWRDRKGVNWDKYLDGPSSFVGQKPMHTRVWLVAET